jgi:hypothetical protein
MSKLPESDKKEERGGAAVSCLELLEIDRK